MNTRSFTFLVLALALILAPLGLCLGHGAAAAAPAHAGMQHGSAQTTAGHSGHGDVGKSHYCPECRPDSFVKAAKAAVPDVAPASLAFPLLVAPIAPLAVRPARLTFARGLSPPPPRPFRTYRIRLQI